MRSFVSSTRHDYEMLDADTRTHRACIGRDLVLLAAPPDEQLEYFNRTGCPRVELFNQWMNWEEMMLPQVIKAGAITPEIERLTSEITESLRNLDRDLAAEVRLAGISSRGGWGTPMMPFEMTHDGGTSAF
jgi:hypothetical protein